MKSIKLLIFSFLLLFQFSCATEPEYNYVTYKINVDKIVHPDTVSINDTLVIEFYGFVGPDGCHRFSHFEKHETQNQMDFTVWGSKPDFETACPAVMVYMNGTEYKTLVNQTGLHQIKVHQPDNSVLIDSIFVE